MLEDTANSVSAGAFPFPGLPPSTLRSIDRQVAELDASIARGLMPPDSPTPEREERTGSAEEGEEEEGIVVDEPSYGVDGEETMDMSG